MWRGSSSTPLQHGWRPTLSVCDAPKESASSAASLASYDGGPSGCATVLAWLPAAAVRERPRGQGAGCAAAVLRSGLPLARRASPALTRTHCYVLYGAKSAAGAGLSGLRVAGLHSECDNIGRTRHPRCGQTAGATAPPTTDHPSHIRKTSAAGPAFCTRTGDPRHTNPNLNPNPNPRHTVSSPLAGSYRVPFRSRCPARGMKNCCLPSLPTAAAAADRLRAKAAGRSEKGRRRCSAAGSEKSTAQAPCSAAGANGAASSGCGARAMNAMTCKCIAIIVWVWLHCGGCASHDQLRPTHDLAAALTRSSTRLGRLLSAAVSPPSCHPCGACPGCAGPGERTCSGPRQLTRARQCSARGSSALPTFGR
jgi:hypothetical protein